MLNLSVELRLHRMTDINNIWTRFIKIGYKNHSPRACKNLCLLLIGKPNDICTFCLPNKEKYKFINGSVSKFGQNATSSFAIYKNTVELQWLEHLWDYENVFETGVVRAIKGLI